MSADAIEASGAPPGRGHALWVRLWHWGFAAIVLALAYSGVVILMAHPRLYWGWTGNDLTRPLIELPLGPNYKHGGWRAAIAFFGDPNGPVTRDRTYQIFNQNSWARSLHFLLAWLLVTALAAFAGLSLATGHLRRDLVPRREELASGGLWRDVREHLALRIPPAQGGPPYGLLQKLAYLGVLLLAFPLMVLTGLSMSPAVAAAWPWLPALFGGTQSARTLHFAGLSLIALFLLAHLAMVVLSGLGRQIRAMTWGR
ncbi:cytochrome b/b6 domain-containing protein [Phenylobacterium aquaticum]|uniref:cytochrome b/b6 domain-containing protein n=1 Tax=Phenylobacterium aquaticum TaxID=1763816 RepID=UPI001F5CE91C|nr:cytochrome b/b6 domain-containing protein [Phenylobacterium aquaticum]MCI3135448.1 cytochrome b/b6 domain-containing protein [Phenylobacterium aquaticum]